MPRLRFSADAKHDLHEITRYIASDKPIAARQWVVRLKAKCHLLATHPELGEQRPDLGADIRCAVFGSYIIFFRHVSNVLEIARVIRGDREIRSL